MRSVAEGRLDSYRTDQLQFLRFLAFLNVFIVHADMWIFFYYPSACCGASAVSFFIILSGFLTGYGAYNREMNVSFRRECAYMWKKLRKFYPLFFVTNLFTLLYGNTLALIIARDYGAVFQRIYNFLAYVLFVPRWHPDGGETFNPASWTMGVLMFLYLFNLPVSSLLNRINKSTRRYYILGAMVICLWGMQITYNYLLRGSETYWRYMFPPARMFEYFIGMIVGFMLRSMRGRIPENKAQIVLFTILEAGTIALWYFALKRPGSPWRRSGVSWLIPNVALITVFTCGLGMLSRLFRCRLLVKLGDVSFECYLIHQIVIMMFLFLNDIPEDAVGGKAYAFLFCLTLSICMALLVSRGRTPYSGGKKLPAAQ